jgi:hypothetical protein
MFPHLDAEDFHRVALRLFIQDNQQVDGTRTCQEWQGIVERARSRTASILAADQAIELHSFPLDTGDDADRPSGVEQ